MSRLADLHKNASSNPALFWTDYCRHVADVLRDIDSAEIAALVIELDARRKRDSTVYFLGNGGKAALAAEWVNDLTVALPDLNPAFRCVAPACNVVALTAAANDYSYEQAFSRLLMEAKQNDLVVLLSGSGESRNINHAALAMRLAHVRTVGIGRGGLLQHHVDVFVRIPAEEDGPTEDAMMAVLHCVHNWFKHLKQ